MNDWDRDNLEFLLNTKGKEFKLWFAQATPDDIDYAFELIAQANRELDERAKALEIECQLELMDEYPDALRVIKQVVDKK